MKGTFFMKINNNKIILWFIFLLHVFYCSTSRKVTRKATKFLSLQQEEQHPPPEDMLSDNDKNKAKAKENVEEAENADQNFYNDVHNKLAAIASRL